MIYKNKRYSNRVLCGILGSNGSARSTFEVERWSRRLSGFSVIPIVNVLQFFLCLEQYRSYLFAVLSHQPPALKYDGHFRIRLDSFLGRLRYPC
jgi:hypothetical protein